MKLSQRVIQNIQNTPNLPSLRYKNTCFSEMAYRSSRNRFSKATKRRIKTRETAYQNSRHASSQPTLKPKRSFSLFPRLYIFSFCHLNFNTVKYKLSSFHIFYISFYAFCQFFQFPLRENSYLCSRFVNIFVRGIGGL